MSLILNIDTAQENASVCLSNQAEVLQLAMNNNRQDHAAWLQVAIREMFAKTGLAMKNLEAVGVSIGPGSYTGLRVGLSSAKGICYALQIPLIAVGTLEMMALAIKEEAKELICPLIDARRMEVYVAVYDQQLKEMLKPAAMIIDDKSFHDLLSNHNLIFCGSGSKKVQQVITHPHATFSDTIATAAHLSGITYRQFMAQQFADLAYTQPFYIKDFHSSTTGRNEKTSY